MTKYFKRKIVLEIGSDRESPADIPEEYSNHKQRWLEYS
jgi:hypothetical protein